VNRTMHGVIAAGHPATARAGAAMLRRGGNAFDAVVAAALASFVAEPTLTSAGGGGFCTTWEAVSERGRVYDFFVTMPGAGGRPRHGTPAFFPIHVDFGTTRQVFHVGPASVAVPGNPAGLWTLHRDLGSLPLEVVVEPAALLARDGVEINGHQAYFMQLLEPILTLTSEGRGLFAPHGRLLCQGERLVMPGFDAFLETPHNHDPRHLDRRQRHPRVPGCR